MSYEKVNPQDNKLKAIYNELKWDKGIELNGVRVAPNGNSYHFAPAEGVKEQSEETLIKQFGIEDKERFKAAFAMACSGSGNEGGKKGNDSQNENKKIMTLHSSSLCALLHFFPLVRLPEEESNSIEATFDDDDQLKRYKFTEAVFEFKNRVINGGAPSNVDVVLLGYKEGDLQKKAVLFLESKFKEYITDVSGKLEISENYLNDAKCGFGAEVYNDASFKKEYNICGNTISAKSETCYLKGIKQIISHYIGIRRLLRNNVESKDRYYSDRDFKELKNTTYKKIYDAIDDHNTVVFLGEILFPFNVRRTRGTNKDSYLMDYNDRYTQLTNVLESQIPEDLKDRFIILKNDLEYKEFSWISKETGIASFYNYNK